MVCKYETLHNFDERYWVVKGFVALKIGLIDELSRLDSILRQNTYNSTRRQINDIKDFHARTIEMTMGGWNVNPVFYWKRRVDEDCLVGRCSPSLETYPKKGQRFAYYHLWLVCHCALFVNSKCCLAVLIGAVRYGTSCLHPKLVRVPRQNFLISSPTHNNVDCLYTLSEYIRPVMN